MNVDDIDTPAAVVDVERLDSNLTRWQQYCDRHGFANRPHVKTHRCVEIARRQLELGAVGVTCQKLGEAETMADAGCDDILVAFNILGAAKLARLRELLERVAVTVSVDDAALLPGLAEAASGVPRELGVLVDCDTGFGRTGVTSPEQAVALALEVQKQRGLRFDGFLTFPVPNGARAFLDDAVVTAGKHGLAPAVVSAGGTLSMWESARLRPTVTEYRAGTYVFNDRSTVGAGAAALADVALTVHATVVSRPASDRAVLDAGSKALSSDPGPDAGFGLLLEAPHSPIVRLSEEHAWVTLVDDNRLELGQVVRIVPNHVCVAVNLFDELHVARGGRIETTWAVAARGRSQ